jgi:aryl-alcohol dehydrogenase-like predicted oxidoreductase
VLDRVAKKLGATGAQIALAWVLQRSRVMLPIPGTSRVSHLEENVAAAGIQLDDDDFRELDDAGRSASASKRKR